MTEVPPQRSTGRYRIGVVCLGNICRSPVAAAVLRHRIADAGLADRVEVVSSGTGDWHVGEPMDRRAAATLTTAGYDASHTAQQIQRCWLTDCDLLLAMDETNIAGIAGLGEIAPGRLRKFRDFDPIEPGGDVPDPYFGGPEGFDRVLAMVERTCDVLVERLAAAARRP